MQAPAAATGFETANEHALATILDASQTRSIIACNDIFDIAGTKLWARSQPVSQELQRKLLDRRLRQPLESCLMAEDGVTAFTLLESMEALLASDSALMPMLEPHAARLLKETPYMPLHPVAQLLLTAGQETRPQSFAHVVEAMALAGALVAGQGGTTQELRLAMICGLLHDLGEMYIDPRYGEADADRNLDFESYQQLVVHPHVGQLLLAQLTDYPKVVTRGVAEHHERLDGSGYPYRLEQAQVSPMGRVLAVTEAALGVLRRDGADLARASVALRVVPSEHDMHWVGQVARAARALPKRGAGFDPEAVRVRLEWLDTTLADANLAVDALRSRGEHASLSGALDLTRRLLGRLRAGWDDSGLWSPRSMSEQDLAEVDAIEDELRFRLRGIERAARLRAGPIDEDDEEALHRICRDWVQHPR